MFSHALFSGSMATGGVDFTADFAPLFVGMWVLLSLCVLALAFAIGRHDARTAAQQSTEHPVTEPESLSKAA